MARADHHASSPDQLRRDIQGARHAHFNDLIRSRLGVNIKD
jgi:hypothetical protein